MQRNFSVRVYGILLGELDYDQNYFFFVFFVFVK